MPIQSNPILWTRSQVERLTSGEWLSGAGENWFATGVRREPHRAGHGDLFITAGSIGEECVTNDVNRLFAQGAVAVITNVRPSADQLWGPVLLVDDTLHVYESLAADSLVRTKAKVIGVTGSVGKTGTKNAIAHVLSHQGSVLSTPGSANSDTAILEMLCQLSPSIDYAVAELGMLGPGSMSRKTALCRPHVALITAIGTSHRHHHDSDFSIARTKADILDGVPPGGGAVLPRDSQFFDYLADRARSLERIANVVTFGRHDRADMRLIDHRLFANASEVEAEYRGVRFAYRVGLPGEHHVSNSLAVLAVVGAVDADVPAAAATLASLCPTFRRGERFRIELPDGPCEIIDDSWNASPDSVSAAIHTLGLCPIPSSGRRIVALGDMLELGPDERRLHRALADVIETSQVDLVHTAGTLMRELHEALPDNRRGRHFATAKEMAAEISNLVATGDCLLVKGSHSTEMSRVVVAALRGRAREVCAAPRLWNVAAELNATSIRGDASRQDVESDTNVQSEGVVIASPESAAAFCTQIRNALATNGTLDIPRKAHLECFEGGGLPASFWGFAVTLYQPGAERLMVVRAAQQTALENVRQVLRQIPNHPRFGEFDVSDWIRCRMQVDFIVDEPQPVVLAELSDAVLPELGLRAGHTGGSDVTASQPLTENAHHGELSGCFAPWQMQVENWTMPTKQTRFELGVDGLRIVKEGKRRYFLPGDAFVHSILGMSQLRRHIQRLFPGDDIEKLTYYRFRSISFVSGVKGMEEGEMRRQGDGESGKGESDGCRWLPLYRGLPPVPEVNDASLLQAARAGTKWIADNVQSDGRFTYYYDAATDTRRDHEHPTRDPETDPYYNLLRHAGGVITLLWDEELGKKRSGLGKRSAVSGQRSAVSRS